MEMLSLQMPEELLKTTRRCAKSLHVSRATYIRCAIERMNRKTQAQLRAKRLAEASKRVRRESLRINRELAAIEHALDA
jgi:predicted DNA-binding protein